MKKKKSGPVPLGLGPLFSIRLTRDQDKEADRLRKKLKISKSQVIRDALDVVWG